MFFSPRATIAVQQIREHSRKRLVRRNRHFQPTGAAPATESHITFLDLAGERVMIRNSQQDSASRIASGKILEGKVQLLESIFHCTLR